MTSWRDVQAELDGAKPGTNNPGNLKDSKTGEFRVFHSPEAGYQALLEDMQGKGKKGFNTISSIINRYAPPSDNNPTAQYIKNVSSWTGLDPNAQLDMNDPNVQRALADAITRQENNKNMTSGNLVPGSRQATAPQAPASSWRDVQKELEATAPQAPASSWRDVQKELDVTPAVNKQAYARFTEPEPMSTEPTLGDKTIAVLRGFGKGQTAGLIQYPQAAIMAATGPRTYRESLAEVRSQEKELEDKMAAQYYGGQIAGGANLAYLSGGGSLVGQVGASGLRQSLLGGRGIVSAAPAATATREAVRQGAIGAGIGGVSGFTQDESLKDAGIGSVVGGTLGALGGAAGKGLDYLGNKIGAGRVIQYVDDLLENKPKGWKDKLSNIIGYGEKEAKAQGTTVTQEAKNLSKALKSKEVAIGDIPELAAQPALAGITPGPTRAAQIMRAGLEGAKGGLYGLGANELYGALSGQEVKFDPLAAATGGFVLGAGGAGRKIGKDWAEDVLVKRALAQTATTWPSTMARGTTLLATPSVVNVGGSGDETRLGRLAARFRASQGY